MANQITEVLESIADRIEDLNKPTSFTTETDMLIDNIGFQLIDVVAQLDRMNGYMERIAYALEKKNG